MAPLRQTFLELFRASAKQYFVFSVLEKKKD